MDLKIFFSPVPEEIYDGITDSNSFYKNIRIFADRQPSYKNANIAIIGITETRGATNNEGCEHAANEIRKKLYRLKKGTGAYRIIDLGNVNNGITLEETHLRVREICSILIEKDILPLLIGSSHDFTYSQYLAYESLDKLVSMLNIDAFLDMEDEVKSINNKNHLHHIMMYDNNFLFNLCQMAYQSYLIDNEALTLLEKLYFDSYRLGYIRQGLKEMEPIVREADFMSFDITAIKSSDAPGNENAQPFGLTGEEACQICWYAGLNEKMSSAGFYEYNPEYDENKKTASVVATMIWYYIEGFYHRKDESNFRGNHYLRYVVSMPEEPVTMVFYKSKLSEKWWMEVPYPHGKFLYERNLIIPCSYSDYQTAQKGEVPERWISTQNKLI